MTTLEDQPVSVWNNVLESYINTKAKLEIRRIQWVNETRNNYQLMFPQEEIKNMSSKPEHFISTAEKFIVRVEGQEEVLDGGVRTLLGTLQRFNQGIMNYSLSIKMKWHPLLFGWLCPLGSPQSLDCMVALCGNVVGYTVDVEPLVSGNAFPFLYEWNRPDAPKGHHRKWITKK